MCALSESMRVIRHHVEWEGGNVYIPVCGLQVILAIALSTLVEISIGFLHALIHPLLITYIYGYIYFSGYISSVED